MLLRWDPFRELDRLTETAFKGMPQATALPMDAYRQGDTFIAHFDLPGVDPDSIELTVEKNVLTVAAERHWSRTEGDDVVVSERVHGTFRRQLFLGESLDTDHIDASYDNGVLTLRVPIAEKAKARKVSVTVGGGDPKPVEATSQEATPESHAA